MGYGSSLVFTGSLQTVFWKKIKTNFSCKTMIRNNCYDSSSTLMLFFCNFFPDRGRLADALTNR